MSYTTSLSRKGESPVRSKGSTSSYLQSVVRDARRSMQSFLTSAISYIGSLIETLLHPLEESGTSRGKCSQQMNLSFLVTHRISGHSVTSH